MRNYIHSLKSEGHENVGQFEGLRDVIGRNDKIADRADDIAPWPRLQQSSQSNGIKVDVTGVTINGKYLLR